MGQPNYAWCRNCGRHRSEAGTMSWTRLCAECSIEIMDENVIQLHTMTGPAVTRWRRGMAASVGAVLLDDAPVDA